MIDGYGSLQFFFHENKKQGYHLRVKMERRFKVRGQGRKNEVENLLESGQKESELEQ